MDYVSRCAVAAQTKGDGYVITGESCSVLLPLETVPNGLGAFTVGAAAASVLTYNITSPAIESDDIRTALTNRSNINVTITASTDKKVTFTFKK